MSLHIITLHTNAKDSALANWKYSVDTLGYNYEILGRGKTFKGWSWRTSKYLKAVKYYNTINPNSVIMLCDAGDLFFIQPPGELLKRFHQICARENTSVIISGEMTCCTGIYSNKPYRDNAINTIEEYKNNDINTNKTVTRYMFPNAGSVIGYASKLVDILTDIKNEPDDQAGYLSRYIIDRSYVYVDKNQEITANVNSYDIKHAVDIRSNYILHYEEMKFYEPTIIQLKINNIMKDQKVYRNIITNTVPIVMHYPGGNNVIYNLHGKYIYGDIFNQTSVKFQMFSPKLSISNMLIPIAHTVSQILNN